MKRSALAATLLFGCTTPRPEEPLASSVHVRVINPFEVVPASPLRYAVVWATKRGSQKGFLVTGDGPVGDLPSTVAAPLAMPDPGIRQWLNPVQSLALTAAVFVGAYRPRIVVYEDVDENARFEPSVLGGTGPDRVLGIQNEFDSSPTAILDLDGALSRLSLPETEQFYAHSGGRYSSFVWAEPVGTALVLTAGDAVSVFLRDSRSAEADLDCFHQAARTIGPGALGPSATAPPTRAVVDSALDAKAICGVTITDCSSADFASLTPPSFEQDDKGEAQRLLQCRSNDVFEFLLIVTTSVDCDGCACKSNADYELLVTTPSSRPAWWPCGAAVPYCKSALPAYTFDAACLAGALDGGAPDAN
jgi:hypothetical protein